MRVVSVCALDQLCLGVRPLVLEALNLLLDELVNNEAYCDLLFLVRKLQCVAQEVH